MSQAAIVYAANRLAHHHACRRDDAHDLPSDPVFVSLGLDERSLAVLETRLPRLFDVARTIAA